MEKMGFISKFFRLIYKNIFLRFSRQIRDPYLIKVDNIYPDTLSNELKVSFHIANKRVEKDMSVAKFVKTNMLYLVDPMIVFHMGEQSGIHSEKLIALHKKTDNPTSKSKCVNMLKRVFIDE